MSRLSQTKSFATTLALVALPAAVAISPPTAASAGSCTEAVTNIPLPSEEGPCADVLAPESTSTPTAD